MRRRRREDKQAEHQRANARRQAKGKQTNFLFIQQFKKERIAEMNEESYCFPAEGASHSISSTINQPPSIKTKKV